MSSRNLRALIVFVAALVVAAGCGAATKNTERPVLPTPDRNLDKHLADVGHIKTFDNGLTLFVMPDPYTRLVQFDVRHHVGSREDPAGKGGMAHFVEHLMFQLPADGPGSELIMSHAPQHTLFFNAYTAADETHYIHTGTVSELETYMKYTALRLNYDCSAVNEDEFIRERDVVRNEHRWRGDAAGEIIYDALTKLAFPEGHPYRHESRGIDLQVASITPEDTCEFIKRYYTPSQAFVVVTGDVEPLQVLELAKKYLAPLPKVKVPERKPVAPAEFTQKEATIAAPVKKPSAMVLFKMPNRFSKDYMAAQAAVETLFLSVAFFTGTNKMSVVDNFYGTGFGGKEALVFGVAVEPKEPEQLDRAVNEVIKAINRGFSADVSGKEYRGTYDSARQRARLQILEGIANVMSRSVTFADYLDEGPAPGFHGGELAALDDLTAEHAQEVGRRLFSPKNAMIVKVVSDGSKERPKVERADFAYEPKSEENLSVPEDIDPAEAHRPLAIEDIAPPEGQSLEYELDNGMKVVLVQSTRIPVMNIQLIVGAGVDDSDQPDFAQLAANAYGVADDRDARNLMSFFDAAGGYYFSGIGATATTFRSAGLSIYLDFIIAGLSERTINAEYQTGALDYWKLGRQKALQKKSQRQVGETDNAFYTALYGEGHPLVRRRITDPKQLRDISLRELEEFRRAHYRAANSTLIITGGFDIELAIQYIERFFGKPQLRDRNNAWSEPGGKTGSTPIPPPKPGAIRVMTQVDNRASQTDVRIAYPLSQVYGNDHAALLVMTEMLNHELANVRLKLGASYGVYARLDAERPRIEAWGALDSTKADAGYKAMLAAVQRMRSDEDFDRLFAFARRNVLRQMLNQQGDPALLAEQLAQAVRAGRSYDYFRELARQVSTLQPKAVKAQVAKVLRDQASVTLISGPGEGIVKATMGNGIKDPKVLPDVVHEDEEK
jgi:predicted Zn-dependent peptidase